MKIEFTNRNIKAFIDYRKNFDLLLQVSSLEPSIDGAVIKSDGQLSIETANELFKKYVIQQTNFSEEEYQKSFEPIKKISSYDFMMDPYLKKIHLSELRQGDFSIEHPMYQENEFAILNESTQRQDLSRSYKIGIFDGPAYTYVLKENDQVWMSINPMEMATAASAITHASGRVLVLGGGLAYVPYMISLKDEVSSITIVEKNDDVCRLISDHILPQFPNKKITIVHADAYEYLDAAAADAFDFIYVDTWIDNVEGFREYQKFLAYEEKFKCARFDYWLEPSILDDVVIMIYQYFSAKLGNESSMQYYAALFPDFWSYFEKDETALKRPDAFNYYLTRNYAKKLLKELTRS